MKDKISEIVQFLSKDTLSLNDRVDGKFFKSLENENIIYKHVSHLNELNVECDYSNKTLIVHDGDIPTDIKIFERYNFNRVFCQNLNSPENQKLKCVPIGMESSEYTIKNGWDKFDVIKNIRKLEIKPTKLLYANFSIETNWEKRSQCIKSFHEKNFLTNDVVTRLKHPSILNENEYDSFCRKIMDHVFVLCPEGNGIDTHRLWETLYLGRIPVVLHNHVNDSFKDLPILILDKWEDFSDKQEWFLNNIISNKKYNFEKLSFGYWKNIIQNQY